MPFSPPKYSENRLAFWKAFQELWVAGTLGAFFAAFARNLPVHLSEWSWPPSWDYTIDRFVRYGYLLWFLAYFFTSNFQNKQSKTVRGEDIGYDVLQSAAALAAAYFLGFVAPCAGCTLSLAYGVTNIAILAICFLSLVLFRHDPHPRYINVLRSGGLLISGVSVVLTVVMLPQVASPSTGTLLVFGGLLLLLWFLLAIYIRIRVNGRTRLSLINKSTGVGDKGCGSPVDISSVTGKNWLLSLYTENLTDEQSLVVTVEGSRDSDVWTPKTSASSAPQTKGGLPDWKLDLSGCSEIRFLRACWKVGPSQAATGQPRFELQLSA